MKKIKITLEIEDQEAVENYFDIHDELIFEDLVRGNLINYAKLVKIEREENGTPNKIIS